MNINCMRGAHGIMFVYDITNQESYDQLRQLLKYVEKNGDKETVRLLVGSKCDLSAQRVVKTETASVNYLSLFLY